MADNKQRILIKQIIVEADGKICRVALDQDRMDILLPLIETLADGPIPLVHLAGGKSVEVTS